MFMLPWRSTWDGRDPPINYQPSTIDHRSYMECMYAVGILRRWRESRCIASFAWSRRNAGYAVRFCPHPTYQASYLHDLMYVWQVFRTKARAPSLMVCVVQRDDLSSAEHYSLDTADYLDSHFAREAISYTYIQLYIHTIIYTYIHTFIHTIYIILHTCN
jgi:hypothetical protein